MSERLSDLSSSKIAFRVMIFAGALGMLGGLRAGLDGVLGGLLLLASAALLYEAWVRRWSRRRLRSNLLWAGLSLAAAMVLVNGWLVPASTPLLALAAVCGALGVIAMLSESGE